MDLNLLKDQKQELSDEELVSRFKNGDKSDFIILVDRYKKGLYRMFYRALRNSADAEDLTQETLFRVYANLNNFRGDSSFKTWIYRIGINLATNYRKSGRYTKEILDDSLMEKKDGRATSVLEEMVSKDTSELLKNAIDSLPPKQKITLSLKLEKELKNKEIAEILDCPIGTVKANLFHAVNSIRKSLLAKGYEFQ